MVRLSRAELQRHNRARVLSAAHEEFAAAGFRDAKIDSIAERAELTRGAVYSNFPSKRALYFAVVADLFETPANTPSQATARDPVEAVSALARAWVGRLPLGGSDQKGAHVGADVLNEVRTDQTTRQAFAQLMKLDAIVLGLALEQLAADDSQFRRIRVADAVLTTLHGASQMAAAAPGFIEPFDIVAACTSLAGTDFEDGWTPPHETAIAPARRHDAPWAPPLATDLVSEQPARLEVDGVIAILGLNKLEAIEQAVRAAPPNTPVTATLVTGDPLELAPLARVALSELTSCLRSTFPVRALGTLQVVLDDTGAIARAAGVSAVSNDTESAARVSGNRIVARADGLGSCHSIASWPAGAPQDAADRTRHETSTGHSRSP